MQLWYAVVDDNPERICMNSTWSHTQALHLFYSEKHVCNFCKLVPWTLEQPILTSDIATWTSCGWGKVFSVQYIIFSVVLAWVRAVSKINKHPWPDTEIIDTRGTTLALHVAAETMALVQFLTPYLVLQVARRVTLRTEPRIAFESFWISLQSKTNNMPQTILCLHGSLSTSIDLVNKYLIKMLKNDKLFGGN